MEPSRGRNKGLAPSVSSRAKSAESEGCLYSWHTVGWKLGSDWDLAPQPQQFQGPFLSKAQRHGIPHIEQVEMGHPTPHPRQEVYSAPPD